jgi:hypothetical protein
MEAVEVLVRAGRWFANKSSRNRDRSPTLGIAPSAYDGCHRSVCAHQIYLRWHCTIHAAHIMLVRCTVS